MSAIEQLEEKLEDVEEVYAELVAEGDEQGAAYLSGKQSAFITAIEIVNDCSDERGTDRSENVRESDGGAK